MRPTFFGASPGTHVLLPDDVYHGTRTVTASTRVAERSLLLLRHFSMFSPRPSKLPPILSINLFSVLPLVQVLQEVFPGWATFESVDFGQPGAAEAAAAAAAAAVARGAPRVIAWIETPSNPLLKVRRGRSWSGSAALRDWLFQNIFPGCRERSTSFGCFNARSNCGSSRSDVARSFAGWSTYFGVHCCCCALLPADHGRDRGGGRGAPGGGGSGRRQQPQRRPQRRPQPRRRQRRRVRRAGGCGLNVADSGADASP